ncbi:MAG TPA: hypothetical protein VF221_17510 [Chloroflexota bacterium]
MTTSGTKTNGETAPVSHENELRPRSDGTSWHASRRPRYVYDPLGEVRVARLRQAWAWMDEGAIYQALSAYADMLSRYTGTPTAAAAAEDLLEMVRLLVQEGRFYTALDVLRKVADGV